MHHDGMRWNGSCEPLQAPFLHKPLNAAFPPLVSAAISLTRNIQKEISQMNEKISIMAGLAAIVGIGLAGFQTGISVSANEVSKNFNVAIDALEQQTNNLPPEKQEELGALFDQFALYMKRSSLQSELSKEVVEKDANKLVATASEISLAAYKAKKSPFILTESVVNLFCGDKISLAYLGESSRDSKLKINGKTIYMGVGDHTEYTLDDVTLHLLLLEYNKEKSSPIVKYECS